MRWRAPVFALLGVVLGFFLARSLLLDGLEQVGLRIAIDVLSGEPPPFGNFNLVTFATSSVALRLVVGIIAGGVGGWMLGNRMDNKAPREEPAT